MTTINLDLDSFSLRHIFAITLLVLGIVSVLVIGEIPTDGDDRELLMFSAGLYAVGLGLFTWGFGRFQKLQFITSTPTSKIRSMAKGNVQVKGKSRVLDDTLISPFTGNECIYYRYEVKERRKSSTRKSRRRWVTIDQGEEYVDFAVDDDTGVAIIDPDNAEFDLPADKIINVGRREEPPEQIQNFIQSNEKVDKKTNKTFSFLGNRRKYREWYITPNEDLYIYGYADNINIDGENYHLIKDGGVPLYYISDKTEDEIKRSWSWTYKAMILGGIILTPTGYYIMGLMTGTV